MATQYQALLDAVASYYGRGSDEWAEIAKYGLSADNCAAILKQTPNVTTTLSKDGSRILSYTVSDTASLATQSASAAINSNTQTALMTRTATINAPANMAVDASTTAVAAETGLKTVSTGATVTATLGKVAAGVAAAAAGIQLGAAIDSVLYNANPDFWDSNNMSSLNPETWDSICSTETGKDIFNMVFGINKDTGESQAYIEDRALAYFAQYLTDAGAFGSGETSYKSDNNINSLFSDAVVNYMNFPLEVHKSFDFIDTGNQYNTPKRWVIPELNGVSYFFYGSGETYNIVAIAENQTILNWTAGNDTFTNITMNSATTQGETYYYRTIGTILFTNTPPYHINAAGFSANIGGLLYYYTKYGTPTISGIDGITTQDGATTPSGITSDMSIDDVITQLQTLYPDLFDDAITNDVVQDDGSVSTITYVPVPIPDGITVGDDGEIQPVGGVDLSQADNTITDNSTDNVIQTLFEILTSIDPYNPTTDDIEPDYPDTGDGDTPAIILPSGSANALYSIYNPSQTEINSFGAWLWSSNFVDQLLKIFNDPMQAVIGLHKIFATPSISGSGTIKVGYLDSGVSSNLVSNQYTTIDCGSVDLYEYFGNVLDYINTDIYCYLPFVGIVRLNVDDVMRSSINISYKVDVLTGACLASINITRDAAGGQLYTYAGNCAVQYPLSSGSYMGIVSSLLGVAGSVVGTIASGGAMLPLALGVGANAITGAKTKVEQSGSISGNAGAMGIKTPYLIIRRPQTDIAKNFSEFSGVASNAYVTLSSCSGYTKVNDINLTNIDGATGSELTEIDSLLKSGVLI